MKKNVLFLFIITLISCSDKPSNQNVKTTVPVLSIPDDSLFYWISAALDSGDKRAYNKASYNYFIKSKYEDFLFPAIVMANKYDHPEAYYHVFEILKYGNNTVYIDKLDEKTRDFALFYLVKSYEMGYHEAKNEIESMYKNLDSLPKSSYFLQKYTESMSKQ